jgi:hypothetical protein
MGETQMREIKKPLVLTEDPLTSKNVPYLEEILAISEGYKYLEAVQTPPYWSSVGMPTNSQDNPINTRLPGGRIVRYRYSVSSIREHYREISQDNRGPSS